mmetsp:Transcript_30491/g.90401  ORF Transcript_30491/g.90401 Transcript_30491/m.90401 type:complete len:487 (+) Transcript_30491:1301-2761(+)
MMISSEAVHLVGRHAAHAAHNIAVVVVASARLVLVCRQVCIEEADLGVPDAHADGDASLVGCDARDAGGLRSAVDARDGGADVVACKQQQSDLPHMNALHEAVMLPHHVFQVVLPHISELPTGRQVRNSRDGHALALVHASSVSAHADAPIAATDTLVSRSHVRRRVWCPACVLCVCREAVFASEKRRPPDVEARHRRCNGLRRRRRRRQAAKRARQGVGQAGHRAMRTHAHTWRPRRRRNAAAAAAAARGSGRRHVVAVNCGAVPVAAASRWPPAPSEFHERVAHAGGRALSKCGLVGLGGHVRDVEPMGRHAVAAALANDADATIAAAAAAAVAVAAASITVPAHAASTVTSRPQPWRRQRLRHRPTGRRPRGMPTAAARIKAAGSLREALRVDVVQRDTVHLIARGLTGITALAVLPVPRVAHRHTARGGVVGQQRHRAEGRHATPVPRNSRCKRGRRRCRAWRQQRARTADRAPVPDRRSEC